MSTALDDPEAVQQTLQMWNNDLIALFDKIRTWSDKQGWATLLDDKLLQEREVGRYKVPVLLIHTPKGRLLLDPYARFVYDADGALDICVFPSFGTPIKIIRKEFKWWLWDTRADDGAPTPLDESTFVAVVKNLQETP
jgi:hypothetical protein